ARALRSGVGSCSKQRTWSSSTAAPTPRRRSLRTRSSCSSRRELLQCQLAPERPGPLVPRLEADRGAPRRLHDPLDLRPVARRVIRSPPEHRTPVHPAVELADLDLPLAADDPAAFRQRDLPLERPPPLPLARLLGHARREPTGVLEDEPDEPAVITERLGVERSDLQARRDEQGVDRELGLG